MKKRELYKITIIDSMPRLEHAENENGQQKEYTMIDVEDIKKGACTCIKGPYDIKMIDMKDLTNISYITMRHQHVNGYDNTCVCVLTTNF
jgi:hypothetical protein